MGGGGFWLGTTLKPVYTVNLAAETKNGDWYPVVRDRSEGDTGFLDSWAITLPIEESGGLRRKAPAHSFNAIYAEAFERPRNTVLAEDAFLMAVSIWAIVDEEVIPGTVAVFNAYKVNVYGLVEPPGQGPKNFCELAPDPIAFCFAPPWLGTVKPAPRFSGNDEVAAGMSQMAQCSLLPLFARSANTIA